jgi:hypothetical protein
VSTIERKKYFDKLESAIARDMAAILEKRENDKDWGLEADYPDEPLSEGEDDDDGDDRDDMKGDGDDDGVDNDEFPEWEGLDVDEKVPEDDNASARDPDIGECPNDDGENATQDDATNEVEDDEYEGLSVDEAIDDDVAKHLARGGGLDNSFTASSARSDMGSSEVSEYKGKGTHTLWCL